MNLFFAATHYQRICPRCRRALLALHKARYGSAR